MPKILTPATDPVGATSETLPRWQDGIKRAIRRGDVLLEKLGLCGEIRGSDAAAAAFPVFVTQEFLARMRFGDPSDPLLRQVLPISDELRWVEGYSNDPLVESEAVLAAGMLQKYAGRALLVTTGACAIHCRYCFRRHFPYAQVPHSMDAWSDALERIAEDESIEEVLLSGGDPLMLVDSLLCDLVEAIGQIQHVRRLRIHSRLPIVLPSRITGDLMDMLCGSRLTTWMVVHSNHPREIDEEVAAAIGRLVDRGIPVLNQSVLLAGINDDVDTMAALCRRLIDLRVIPYYLHQLDRVAGAAHFSVDQCVGRELVDALRARLPGYAVPQFVVEQEGKPSKTLIR